MYSVVAEGGELESQPFPTDPLSRRPQDPAWFTLRREVVFSVSAAVCATSQSYPGFCVRPETTRFVAGCKLLVKVSPSEESRRATSLESLGREGHRLKRVIVCCCFCLADYVGRLSNAQLVSTYLPVESRAGPSEEHQPNHGPEGVL